MGIGIGKLENLLKWIPVACTLAQTLSGMCEEEHEQQSKVYKAWNVPGIYSWYTEDIYSARYEVSNVMLKIPLFRGIHNMKCYIGTIVK